MNDLVPIVKTEMRGGWLGIPEPFEVIDFLGVALGSYFMYDGVTRKGPQWLTIGLGAIMIYIHSQRFFYAPQSKEGLRALLKALDVKPAEITGLLE